MGAMREWIAALACVACTGSGDALGVFEAHEEVAPPTTGDMAGNDPAPTPQPIANIIAQQSPTNLIVNGDFEDYEDPNVPAGWSIDEFYGYRGMYQPTDGWTGKAVRFVRNAQGRHCLAQ